MLKSTLIHPEILRALAGAGHGSQVLITDGNYPASTGSNPLAARVYLNLAPGLVSATEVARVVASAIPVEAAHVMATHDGAEPQIWTEFRELLPNVALQPIERHSFYAAGRHSDVALMIATGDQRAYANLLLTIGVVAPPK